MADQSKARDTIPLPVMIWLNSILLSPVWGALLLAAFTCYMALTNKPPGSFYMPILFEAFFFMVGYVVFGVLNLVMIIPTAFYLTTHTRLLRVGLVYALLAAIISSYLVTYVRVLPGDVPVFSEEVFGMVLLPMFVVAFSTFYFLRQRDTVTAQ